MLYGYSLGTTWILQVRISMLLLPVVVTFQGLDIDETHQERFAIATRTVIQQFVHEALAAAATMHEHVFQLFELVHVHLHLEVGPARMFAHVAATKTVIAAGDRLCRALSLDHRRHQHEQPPGLRGEFIERAAERLMREVVRHLDVTQRDLDILDALAVLGGTFDFSLVLMQERQRIDQR